MWRDSKLLVLLVIGSLTVMAGGVIAPILPEIVYQLHLDPGTAGSLVSLHFLTVALSVPILGILADRAGSLAVLVPSLVFYALFGMVGSVMPFGLLLLTRALLGVATGGIAAASLGLMGKLYRGEARSQAIAYAASSLSLANIVYPLLGGWVGSLHWQWAFYLYGAGLPLAILATFTFREKLHLPNQLEVNAQNQSEIAINSGKLIQVFCHLQTLRLLLTLSLASGTVYASVVYVPLYLQTTLGTGTALNGIVLASEAIGATFISIFGLRRLAKTFGNILAIALGFGIMALTLIALPQLHQIYWILPTAILFGLGFGIVVPTLYSSLADQAPAHLQSSILAAGTGAGFLGQFLSPILLGVVLTNSGLTEVFYTAATVSLAAGLLVLSSLRLS